MLDKPSHDQNVQVQDLKIVISMLEKLIQNIVHQKNILNALKSQPQKCSFFTAIFLKMEIFH